MYTHVHARTLYRRKELKNENKKYVESVKIFKNENENENENKNKNENVPNVQQLFRHLP